MKKFLSKQWSRTSRKRVAAYLKLGGGALAAVIIIAFLYCAAQRNKQFHINNVMRIQHEIAERTKEIKCYETLKDATHLYFDVYRSRSGMAIRVGDDDKGACRTLEARRRAV